MTGENAVKVAQLWRTGKMIGGDPYEVCDALVEMVDKLKKDAERYRWIRQSGAWESEIRMDILSENPVNFDNAVDNAMKGKNGSTET